MFRYSNDRGTLEARPAENIQTQYITEAINDHRSDRLLVLCFYWKFRLITRISSKGGYLKYGAFPSL